MIITTDKHDRNVFQVSETDRPQMPIHIKNNKSYRKQNKDPERRKVLNEWLKTDGVNNGDTNENGGSNLEIRIGVVRYKIKRHMKVEKCYNCML